jgi:choline dehydrogenase-like flavoprotein
VADEYDVIIVGSGAGGGTLAHRLSPSGKRCSSSVCTHWAVILHLRGRSSSGQITGLTDKHRLTSHKATASADSTRDTG